MAKVTSKLQVTIPKDIARAHGIEPGQQLRFESMGDWIRVLPEDVQSRDALSVEERLRLFDQATNRTKARADRLPMPEEPPKERDWTREKLYRRGSSD